MLSCSITQTWWNVPYNNIECYITCNITNFGNLDLFVAYIKRVRPVVGIIVFWWSIFSIGIKRLPDRLSNLF